METKQDLGKREFTCRPMAIPGDPSHTMRRAGDSRDFRTTTRVRKFEKSNITKNQFLTSTMYIQSFKSSTKPTDSINRRQEKKQTKQRRRIPKTLF